MTVGAKLEGEDGPESPDAMALVIARLSPGGFFPARPFGAADGATGAAATAAGAGGVNTFLFGRCGPVMPRGRFGTAFGTPTVDDDSC